LKHILIIISKIPAALQTVGYLRATEETGYSALDDNIFSKGSEPGNEVM
jgi:hypothetical protein